MPQMLTFPLVQYFENVLNVFRMWYQISVFQHLKRQWTDVNMNENNVVENTFSIQKLKELTNAHNTSILIHSRTQYTRDLVSLSTYIFNCVRKILCCWPSCSKRLYIILIGSKIATRVWKTISYPRN